MERPLKQRLIGATILVAVAVLVLPGLLSGRREVVTLEPTRDDSGMPLRAHEFSLGETLTAEEQAVAADELQPDPVPVEAVVAPEPLPITPPSGVPAAATPATVPAATLPTAPPSTAAPINRPMSSPAAAPASKPSPVPAAANKPAAAPALVIAPPVKAAAVPAATTPIKPASAAPVASLSGWVVQIGSFGTQQKADELVAKLQAKGFRAFTLAYTASGRTLHRVRVGPEQNRQKAEQIAKRLEADGYQPQVAPQE
jgi:DedD protein